MQKIAAFLLLTIAQAKELVQHLFTTQALRRDFDLVRRFTVPVGELGYTEIQLPKDGAFELLGYNIIHGLDGTAAPNLYLKMSNSGDGAAWSNDFLPVRAIASPGAPGSPRYGFRTFWRAISQEEKIKIEFDGSKLSNAVEVEIVFYGRVYTGSKVIGNRVV